MRQNEQKNIDAVVNPLGSIESMDDWIDVVSAHLVLRIEDKQALQSEADTARR